MEDITIEEMKQLVNFYKQKCSDLELQMLQGQIILNRSSEAEKTSSITKSKP
jgi:hypothetical protein